MSRQRRFQSFGRAALGALVLVALVAAAAAGKSRWGDLEVQMAQQKAGASSTAVSEAVMEADHGLRADGGVSGPSLADRVNLGAQILGGQ